VRCSYYARRDITSGRASANVVPPVGRASARRTGQHHPSGSEK
jgi:hypothetical protein